MSNNAYYKYNSLLNLTLNTIRNQGLLYSLNKSKSFLLDKLVSPLLFLKKRKYFSWKNQKVPYFYHKYNKAWKVERTIEIPIFLSYIETSQKFLEIGNVLNHYVNRPHLVVDKYEKSKGILNKDILDFKTNEKYDLILSISTFEHIGVDDLPKKPEKAIEAIRHVIKNLLSKNGKFIISFPTNYNSALNEVLNRKLITNFNLFCYKKVDFSKNLWAECNYKDLKDMTHKQPVGGVVFLELNSRSRIKTK